MEHELAIKTRALERYFLNELEPQDREAFEEHFFTCELCAGDVRATSAFVDNAKAIFKERRVFPKAAVRPLGWFRPSFAFGAVAALCLVVAGYQRFSVIPELKAPRSLGAYITLDGPTRSAGPRMQEGDPLHFLMPWDSASAGGAAFVELRGGTHVVSSGKVDAPAPNQPLDVYFPGTVKPGRYTIVVRALENGQPGRELLRSDFDVTPRAVQ